MCMYVYIYIYEYIYVFIYIYIYLYCICIYIVKFAQTISVSALICAIGIGIYINNNNYNNNNNKNKKCSNCHFFWGGYSRSRFNTFGSSSTSRLSFLFLSLFLRIPLTNSILYFFLFPFILLHHFFFRLYELDENI